MPAEFDPKEYEDRVLKPLRRRSGGLPDDLLLLYDVDPGMSRPELAERLRRVRAAWTQRAGGVTALAKICQQLISADTDRRRTVGDQLADPAWWRAQAGHRDRAAAAGVAALAAELKAGYGGFGLLTSEQAETIGRRAGLDQDALAAAVRAAGLRTVAAVELPAPDLLSRGDLRTLREALAVCRVPTAVHLLHPGLAGPFRLATGFVVPSDPGARLDQDALATAIQAAERTADSPAVRARKEALSLLRTLARDKGVLPAAAALAVILDEIRDQRAEGLPPALLAAAAQRLGLVPDDAAVLVVSLLSAERGDPVRRGPDQIRELLGDGRLREARTLLTGLPADTDGYPALAAQIKAAEDRIDALLAAARTAAGAGHEDEAERALAAAASSATDDEGIAQLWATLPPAPPGEPVLRVTGGTVALGWRAPSTARRGLRYRVRRAPRRVPLHADDGELVAETDAAHVQDGAPPPAQALRYAVFATVDGVTWSRPATFPEVVVLPPVTDVTVRARATEIALAWTAPAGAVVRVRGTEPDRPIATSGNGCVDRDLRTGSTYRYLLVAGYRHGDTMLDAEPVEVRATARPAPTAVTDLAVELVSTDEDLTAVLTWSGPVDTRIRRSAAMPPWEPGARVTAAVADGYGQEVGGPRRVTGTRVELIAAAPTGRTVYVPFTGDESGLIAGAPCPLSVITPVTRLRVRRHADALTVSWVWPPDAGLATVRWETGGETRSRRISRAQYLAESGCRLDAGPGETLVEVVAETTGPLGGAAPAVRATVSARPLRLSYTVDRLPGLRGRTARRLRSVTLRGRDECAGVAVVVVAATGAVLPVRPDRGTVVAERSGLTLGPDRTASIEVEVPVGLARPCWLRCFVLAPDGVTLLDPPVDTMKVG